MTPRLLGRDRELSVLGHTVTELLDGRGTFVALVGEAGIGKTSLLCTCRTQLSASPATVFSGLAGAADPHRRFGLLRRMLGDVPVDRPEDAADVAISVLEQAGRRGPVAVLVDDVHWADQDSAATLRLLGCQAAALGMLVVVTCRPGTVSSTVAQLIDAAASEGTCLRPGPLAPEDLQQLVQERCGQTCGAHLATLLDATSGIPYLAVELLDGLIADRRLVFGDGVVDVAGDAAFPEGLARRAAARAFAAVPDGHVLLRALAAIPGGATPDELADVLQAPLGAVVATSLTAIDAGVLVDNGDAVLFRHDLLRQSVSATTAASVNRALSRRAADVLHRRRADPGRVAACSLAGFDPSVPGHVDALVERGREYRTDHPVAAADLLGQAVTLLPPTDPRSSALVVELGWSLLASGRGAEVGPLLESRIGPYSADDPIDLRRLRGIALSLTGGLPRVAELHAGFDVASLGSSAELLDAERVDATAELALLKVSTGQLRDATAILQWVDASPTPSSSFRRSTVEVVRAWLDAAHGHFETAVHHSRRSLHWALLDDTRRASAATPTVTLAVALDQLGRGDEALTVARDGAARHRLPRWGPPLLQFFGAVSLFRAGRWDDALIEVDVGLSAAADADLDMATFWPFAVGGLIACARGDLHTAHRFLEDSAGSPAGPALGREWLIYASALTADAEGGNAQALQLVDACSSGIDAIGAPALLLNGGPDMMWLALAGGRDDIAQRIAAGLASLRSATESPVVGALSHWASGIVRGDPLPPEATAEELADIGRLPEAARAAHHAAVLYARAGNGDRSRVLAKDAFGRYDALGAEHWARQLRAELRHHGVDIRARRFPQSATSARQRLTPSEAAVVELVAAGLTNTEVAERLVVSRRTVESHLRRVYAKLHVGSRPQLIAMVLGTANDPR